MRRRSQRGATLAELMVAVAVLGVLGSVVAVSVSRSKARVELNRSMADLRAQIERVRALTRSAGSRLNTARLVYGPGCPAFPGGLLWISINPGTGQVALPRTITYQSGFDTLTVGCVNWNYGGLEGAQGMSQFDFPVAPLGFGFSANGRLALPTGIPPADIYIRLRHTLTDDAPPPGIRVLPGGVTCMSSVPPVVPTPGAACD